MHRTLCKHGANPRLWGRLVAGDHVGNLRKGTVNLRHSQPSWHTSISHISLSLARDLVQVNHGLAVTGTTVLCCPPTSTLTFDRAQGKRDRQANRKRFKDYENMQCIYMQLSNVVTVSFNQIS